MTNETTKRPTEPELGNLIEAIRKANSSDSAYQHMLDTIAGDVETRFGRPGDDQRRMVLVSGIVRFIRNWTP